MASLRQKSPSLPIAGFAPGTGISTDRGEVAVEALREGDRVLTMDHGYRRPVWSGPVTRAPGNRHNRVRIAPDSLGHGLPARPVELGRDHRLLLSGPPVALHCNEHEAIAAADHFATRSLRNGGALYHILLSEHELILANGLWCESLFADENWFTALPAALALRLRNRLCTPHMQTARTCLSRHETAAIFGPFPRSGGIAA